MVAAAAGPGEAAGTEAVTADEATPLSRGTDQGGTAMAAWALRAIAVCVATASPLFAGCSGDAGASAYGGSSGTVGFGGGPGTAASGTATQPMLVDVDPDKTMTAQPGQGVGVFTEYATGGHWHVWWTCDTSQTDLPCSFQVTVSVASGAIANASGESLETGDQLTQPSPGQIDVTTQTSTGSDGVRFDASPAAVITLDAKLNGQDDGNLLFFVQDGVVNGNYRGTLTDPLMFEAAGL